ncbi:hypothetical protein [Pseudonocardia sp. GCM10023141]|uniref:hypothetical protein n=1 Tax=Pseudonocardia sp. GCM10023141 TaxID=3252653 RepID=UPI00361860AB
MPDPSLDVWVWVAVLLLLIVLGARAWVVETGSLRVGRTPVKVRVLTYASVAVLAGLVALLGVQGGGLLVQSVVTGTDPSKQAQIDQGQVPDPNAPAVPAAPDPAAVNPPAAGG